MFTALKNDDSSAIRWFQGQASDFDIHAIEILSIRDKLNKILASHTGQPLEKVQQDTDRDNFLSAEDAVSYGLIDKVLTNRSAGSDL